MNVIITALENDLASIKAWLARSETWLVTLIKAEWNLDRQLAIQDLTADLTTFGNTLPAGASAKTIGTTFLAAVEGQFVAQAGAMLYQDVLLAISLATASLNPPQTTGNAGNLSGGVQVGG